MSYINSNYLGLFQTNTSNNYSAFGSFSLSDYASIKTGAYKKLLNSYYNPTSNKTSSAVSKLAESKTGKNLTSVRSNADELSKAAEALYTSGSKSLFTQKEISTKDAAGNVTKKTDYDREAINKAINDFVKQYNDVIDAVDNTESSKVLRSGLSLAKQTAVYTKSLADVGISVNYDNTLSVDKEMLEKADINDLKTLFNGVTSFAYRTSQKADSLGLAAKQSSGTSLYGSNGSYNSYNYYSSIDSYL